MSAVHSPRSGFAWRRFALKLCLATLAAALLLEGGLRFLLWSDLAADWGLAQRLRQPGLWATSSEDRYWRLVHLWKTPEAPTYEPPYDTRLGWTWWNIEPETYRHFDEAQLHERRPVLLFGDSYSACLTPTQECFQGLMEASPLAADSSLLNYGVCGYGFDQILLMVQSAVERHESAHPVAVVGVLVDDDLNRSMLSVREYPKPRLRAVDGRLSLPTEPVQRPEDHWAERGPVPASWGWALLNNVRNKLLDKSGSPSRAEMEELNRLIVRAIVTTLRERDVPFFFLLFHTEHSYAESFDDWHDRLLRQELDGLGAPWYDVRPEIRARALAQDRPLGDFFIPLDQPGGGHYNSEGNLAAFAVLQRGLGEVCGILPATAMGLRPWRFEAEAGEGRGMAVYLREKNPVLARVEDETRIMLRATSTQATLARYALGGKATRFRARAWSHDPDGQDAPLELSARVDGNVIWKETLSPRAEPRAVELDLSGVQVLEWVLEAHTTRGCVLLSDPQLE